MRFSGVQHGYTVDSGQDPQRAQLVVSGTRGGERTGAIAAAFGATPGVRSAFTTAAIPVAARPGASGRTPPPREQADRWTVRRSAREVVARPDPGAAWIAKASWRPRRRSTRGCSVARS